MKEGKDSAVGEEIVVPVGLVAMIVVAALFACIAAALVAGPSEAAFPGENGRIVFTSTRETATNPEGDAEIFTMRPDGSGLVQLTRNEGVIDSDPAYSPDGTRIAFVQSIPRRSDGTVFSRLFVMNADGTGRRQITPENELARHPAWSPDGGEIAYTEVVSKDIVARKALDGSGKRTIVDAPGFNTNPAWSPDGETIAFQNDGDGDEELFKVPSAGGAEERITTNSLDDLAPAWSPDGSKIAFSSPRNGAGENRREILVIDFSGGCCTLKQLTTNEVADFQPAYSPDGTRIVFASDRGGVRSNDEIITIDARTGGGGTNITNTARDDFAPDWQPVEDVPITFTVNNTGNESDASPTDGLCDTNRLSVGLQCTLRAAIGQANANPGADVIRFNIPESVDAGVKTIAPGTPLPPVTDPVTIDGYSQPGASENTLAQGTNAILRIELSGANAQPGAVGLGIKAPSLVRGLAINRFEELVDPRSGLRSGGEGIVVDAPNSKVEGNFIGTDPSGVADLGNGSAGVTVGGKAARVGGVSPEARNLISGNDGFGVLVVGSGDRVEGNLVGTKKNGTTALGNTGTGVRVGSSDNTIGGANPAASNTIAFNGGDGVEVVGEGDVSSATGNRILGNSVFSNAGIGIDLIRSGPEGDDGPTVNDPRDPDSGSNQLQNKPSLQGAATSDTATNITGNLNSAPNLTFLVQFFANPAGENEGKKFIGQTKVTTNANGNVAFSRGVIPRLAAGQTVTATATDPEGNTSEFSAPRSVVAQ